MADLERCGSMCAQFSRAELDIFFAVKHAFDAPGLLNPGKAIPTLARCVEFGRRYVHGGRVAFPDPARF